MVVSEARRRPADAFERVVGLLSSGKDQLAFQGRREAIGELNYLALVGFRLVNVKPPAFEIQIFDSEIERFTYAQAARIKQVNDKTSGISIVY